jgi:transposase InsO family protein
MAHLVKQHGYSRRRAGMVVGLARSSAAYQPKGRAGDAELVEAVRAQAREHPTYGYRRVTAVLRREGATVNHKRVHRIWQAEGLQLPRRRPRKRRYGPKGEVIQKATHPNHVWSYDFVEDRTEKGGKLRILSILDEYTRECLSLRVDRSLSSTRVLECLEWLFLLRGAPAHIRSDNGPEFIATAVQDWLATRRCGTIYITPGSPWENPYIESFIGKLREECLNRYLFGNGREAQHIIEAWRQEYNALRPHSALGYLTPAEFAAQAAACPAPEPVSLSL